MFALACAPTPSPVATSDLAPTGEAWGEVWVAPVGPAGDGSRARPFRDLRAAVARADVVRLLPGTHRSGPIRLDRRVRLEGAPTATVAAPISITAAAALRDLSFSEGISIGSADGAVLERVRLGGLRGEAPLTIHRSTVQLEDVLVGGGRDSGILSTSSTVAARRLRVDAEGAQAALRVIGGAFSVLGGEVVGGRYAAAHVDGAELRVSDMVVDPAEGNGFVLLDGARGVIENSRMDGARRFGLLVRSASLTLYTSTVAAPGESGLAAQGAALVEVRRSYLQSGREAALLSAAHMNQHPKVLVTSSTLAAGARLEVPAVVVAQGRIELRRSTVLGGGGVLAHGPDAHLHLGRARVASTQGPAVSVVEGAHLQVDAARIEGAGADALRLEQTLPGSVQVRGLEVRGARGYGLRILAGVAEASNLAFEGTDRGGILVGLDAELTVDRVVVSSTPVGLAAVGGGTLKIGEARVSASRWSVFETCSQPGEVQLDRAHLRGADARCP
ncbi:MAG: hypothetical protein AAFZ18_00480 [Myxococcota bacterium]